MTTVKHVLTHTALLAVGLALGYSFGMREGFSRGLRHLQAEVSEELALDVEVASSILVSDRDRALLLLDARIDGAVLGLAAAEHNLGQLAAQSGRTPVEALGWARAYRRVVPARGSNAESVRSTVEAAGSRWQGQLGPSLGKLARSSGE